MHQQINLSEAGSNVLALPLQRATTKSTAGSVTGVCAEIVALPVRRAEQEPVCDVEQIIAALAANRIDVVYQPQLDLRSGALRGVEALVRLSDDRGTLLDTAKAITLAERHDFIGVLGRRAVEKAIVGFVDSALGSDTRVQLAINASPQELEDPGYAVWLLSLLQDVGLEPGRLELELTENSRLDVSSCQVEHLTQLHDAGIAIAIDDFGTGLANWQRVLELPVSTVKLDRSFAAQVTEKDSVRKLVHHMAAMAGELHFELMAEGIENDAQLAAISSSSAPWRCSTSRSSFLQSSLRLRPRICVTSSMVSNESTRPSSFSSP